MTLLLEPGTNPLPFVVGVYVAILYPLDSQGQFIMMALNSARNNKSAKGFPGTDCYPLERGDTNAINRFLLGINVFGVSTDDATNKQPDDTGLVQLLTYYLPFKALKVERS